MIKECSPSKYSHGKWRIEYTVVEAPENESMIPAPLIKVKLVSWRKTCLIIGKVDGDFWKKNM